MSVQTEILYPALRLAGVTMNAGRGASTEQIADAFGSLNRLLVRWGTSRLNIFGVQRNVYPLVSQKQIQTIGPVGADITAPRPLRIERANLLLSTVASASAVRINIAMIEAEQWAERSYQSVFSYTRELYNDGNFPNSNLYLFPIPDQAYQIELYTWQGLVPYVTVADAVNLPDGYVDALVHAIAVRMRMQFGLPAREDLTEEARVSLATIEALNCMSPRMKTEPGLLPRGFGGHGGFVLSGGGGSLKLILLPIVVSTGQTVVSTSVYASAQMFRNGLLQTSPADYTLSIGVTANYTFTVPFDVSDTLTLAHS